jgi:hypothetical protein
MVVLLPLRIVHAGPCGVQRLVLGLWVEVDGATSLLCSRAERTPDPDTRSRSSRASGAPPWARQARALSGVFEELVTQDPDITLFDLRDALAMAEGVKAHHSSIAALLSRLGFTYKENRWWPANGAAQG